MDFLISGFIEFSEKFVFVFLRVFRVFGFRDTIRHGQSEGRAIHGHTGVYKSTVFSGFTAIIVIGTVSATAIWVVHFGHGKTLFYCI